MDTIVTPAHRFAAIRIEKSQPFGSDARRAICMARGIDGFPHSYTTEQVRAASRLLVDLTDDPGNAGLRVAMMLLEGDTPVGFGQVVR